MHDTMEELYDLCETLEKDLAKTNDKLRMAGGELSGSDLEYVDKLTHSIKSIKTTMAMIEADDGFSREGGGSYAGGNRGGGGGRSREGGGMSGARGRSRRTGRYVSREGGMSGRRGYSREGGMSYDGARDELMEHVEELMGMADDEPTKQMIRRFKMELEKS